MEYDDPRMSFRSVSSTNVLRFESVEIQRNTFLLHDARARNTGECGLNVVV